MRGFNNPCPWTNRTNRTSIREMHKLKRTTVRHVSNYGHQAKEGEPILMMRNRPFDQGTRSAAKIGVFFIIRENFNAFSI